MATKKLTPFERRMEKVISDSEQLAERLKDKTPFDSECLNDHCCRKNGKREMATAWKTKEGYELFCIACGFHEKYTQNQFKSHKSALSKEVAMNNMQKSNKKYSNYVDYGMESIILEEESAAE